MNGQLRDPETADEIRVEYKRFNTFLADYAHSISRGEMFIASVAPREMGTVFTLALHVPLFDVPLMLKGKVLRVTALDDSTSAKPAGMDVQFLTESHQQPALAERIDRVTREQLGERIAGWLLGNTSARHAMP